MLSFVRKFQFLYFLLRKQCVKGINEPSSVYELQTTSDVRSKMGGVGHPKIGVNQSTAAPKCSADTSSKSMSATIVQRMTDAISQPYTARQQKSTLSSNG